MGLCFYGDRFRDRQQYFHETSYNGCSIGFTTSVISRVGGSRYYFNFWRNDVQNYLSGKTEIIFSALGLLLLASGVPFYWYFTVQGFVKLRKSNTGKAFALR